MAIYKTKTTPKNQAFKLSHAWNFLKDCPRWGTDVDQQWGRLFHSDAPPPNDFDEGANEGVNEGVEQMTPTFSFARPPGRDKQKEVKRKWKSQEPMSGHIATGIAKLSETHSARQEEAARMRLQMKEEWDKEQDRFEINFMMEDLNKYTLERKKFLRGEQKEILRKYATRSIFQDDESSQPYILSPPPTPPTSQPPSQPQSQDGGYDY